MGCSASDAFVVAFVVAVVVAAGSVVGDCLNLDSPDIWPLLAEWKDSSCLNCQFKSI